MHFKEKIAKAWLALLGALKQTSVEPTMLIYMLSFMLTSVVEQAYFVHKACLVNHNYTEEICNNLNDHKKIKEEVQITASTFHQWNNMAAHIFPIFLAMFLGSWSDKRGRKFPLLMGLCGKLIYAIMFMVNIKQTSWPVEYIALTATLPAALTGTEISIFSSCYAYVSDLSSSKNRTIRITILDICYLIAMPTGVSLGSFLFYSAFQESYFYMYLLNGCLVLFAIVYSTCALKWQTTEKQRSLRELGVCGFFPDFFDLNHLKDAFMMFVRKRDLNRRMYLSIVMLMMALYTFQRDEKAYLFLYTQLKWGWKVDTYSNFKTFQSAAYAVMMLTFVPIMTKVLKWRDTVIIMIGCAGHSIARLFYIFATESWIFYIGSVFCSIGPIVGPVLRSMTSKIVPESERGKVFAFLSVCDQAVPFISSICYTQVYNATIGKTAGIFWLTFATQLFVFLLIVIIHVTLGNRILASPDIEASDTPVIEEKSKEDEGAKY